MKTNSKKKTNKKRSGELLKLEEYVRQQTQRKRIETAILGSLSIVGLFAVGAMAPNAVQVLHKALPDFRPLNQKQSVKRAIGRMIQQGYIKKHEGKYHMTQKGRERMEFLTSNINRGLSGDRWDKKWRVVIYDISEDYKTKRDILRNRLIQAGFVKIQNSVWVYPFQCNEIVALLKFEIKLGRSTVYMIVDAIEDDDWLRKHFKLPLN